jgi:hypothetical protein
MQRRIFFVAAATLAGTFTGPRASAAKGDPKPLDPARSLKPPAAEGYFDDVFALDAEGSRVVTLRTDGATIAKLEVHELGTGKPLASFDLPSKTLAADRLELLAPGKGIVLIARERPDDLAPLYAFHFDDSGKLTAKVGPASAFGRPPADGSPRAGLLVGYDRKETGHGAEATITITPHDIATLAPAGKPRVYKTDVAGELKGPGVRLVGVYDGYTRILGERAGGYIKAQDFRGPPRMVILDALTGKIVSEAEIPNVEGWAVTGLLRGEHPGRSVFVELNGDNSGLELIDATGKKRPLTLSVPFRLYDPKSLRVEEGPGPDTLTFGLGVDPLNPEAIKRKKADLPMLDVYTTHVADGTVKLRARVFTPRPVAWKMAGDKLVVLKRFKSFSRGGDELQVFDLR